MTHEEKMTMARQVFDTCLTVLDKKGRDYSGTEDAMSNFNDFGSMGILVRIGDKYNRAKNLTKAGKAFVHDESLNDTVMDMLNYSLLWLIMKHIEEEKANVTGQTFI